MNELQHIFELAREGEWVNGRASLPDGLLKMVSKLNDEQRRVFINAFDTQTSRIVRYLILEMVDLYRWNFERDRLLAIMHNKEEIEAIRRKAARLLAKKPHIEDILLDEYVRENDYGVHIELMDGLTRIVQIDRPPRLENLIIESLEQIQEDIKLANLLRLLAKYKSSRAYEAICPFLTDHRLVSTAIEALGINGDTRAIPLLIGYLNDPDERKKYSATVALGNLNIDPTTIITIRKATRAMNDYNDSD